MKLKKLSALLCAGMVLLSCAACSVKEESSEENQSNSESSIPQTTSEAFPTIKPDVTVSTTSESLKDSTSENSMESEEPLVPETMPVTTTATVATTVPAPEATPAATTTPAPQSSSDKSEGIRPEFKEALDSYEKFFDKYCAFMKKYKESPNDLTLLGEYTDYLTQYTETMEKMSALDDGEMNDEELKYYIKVTNRINEKLIDAAL